MKRFANPVVWSILLIATALLVAGCGCSYGASSDVTVTPAQSCLQTMQRTHCAFLEFDVTNNCTETLTFSKGDDTLTVVPGESATIAPAQFGDTDAIGDSCDVQATIPAMLGSDPVQFEFTYERVNRGLGGC